MNMEWNEMGLDRRKFLSGLLAAPAIIRSPGLLMPIRPLLRPQITLLDFSRITKQAIEHLAKANAYMLEIEAQSAREFDAGTSWEEADLVLLRSRGDVGRGGR